MNFQLVFFLFSLGLGLGTLAIGLVARMIVSFFAVWGTNLNMKEKFFIPFAWLPKATVQVNIKQWIMKNQKIVWYFL